MSEKKQSVGRDMTQGPILPILISFAVPIVLASIIQQLYSMVDLMVIGQFVGSVGTVAVSTGGELSDLMTPVATALATAGQIYLAQLYGAKDETKIKSVISTLLTVLMVISLVVMVLAMIFYKQILGWLNCPSEAFLQAAEYMLITAIGVPFIFGYNVICAIMRAMGESKKPLIFIIVAAVVNIFLDLLLVVVFHWDSAGTAIATVCSQIGAFAAAFHFFYKRKEQFGFFMSIKYFKVNSKDLKIITMLGIPQLVRAFAVQGSMLWVKANINAYGLTASATYSVGNKIEKFMNLFINGVDTAGGAMLGQNIGAKKPDRVRKIMKQLVIISFSMSIIVAILFLVVPTQLYSIFTTDLEVKELGRVFLRVMSLGCIVVGLASPMKSIVTGAGAAKLSLIVGVLDGVMRVVVCMIVEGTTHQGAPSYFWGAALCMLVPGIISAIYYFSGAWERKKLLSEM